ncbi:unnamed protein product [Chilo suppressalis]|uniref:Cytochrome b5 n=1 Tax=Chilo suppressalis TaxID=168631 RepID=A0A0R8YF94_CHISP|nr:cytochrome b5-1 [Chilo suppressalis]CAH0405545.1 unnamed protein product [Chilo suppressalis]
MAAEVKKFTRKEIAASDAKTAARFIINNHVYDVSQFLDEHPGGHEVLVNAVGKDATEDFDDIGHSIDAKELMKKYRIGELVDEDKTNTNNSGGNVKWTTPSNNTEEETSFISSWKFPVVLGILATVLYTYLFG